MTKIKLITYWIAFISKLPALFSLQVSSIPFITPVFILFGKSILINFPDFESVC